MCEFVQNQTICTLVYQFSICVSIPGRICCRNYAPMHGSQLESKVQFSSNAGVQNWILGWTLAHARLGQAGQTGQARQASQAGLDTPRTRGTTWAPHE